MDRGTAAFCDLIGFAGWWVIMFLLTKNDGFWHEIIKYMPIWVPVLMILDGMLESRKRNKRPRASRLYHWQNRRKTIERLQRVLEENESRRI